MSKSYKFSLHAKPDGEPRFFISEGSVDADNKSEARRKVIEDHWDERLNISGCKPSIELKYLGKTSFGKITVDLDIDEGEQMSSRQNAALHGAPGNLAISIDACPAIPEDLATQEAVAAYIKEQLAPLVDEGWQFEIAIGPASE